MAIKTSGKPLTEAEMNSPDLDDDGDTDVEYYPANIQSGNDYLDKVWKLAAEELNKEST
jgi:hypothetical protein